MGLINWIFDIYQHTKIDEARKEAMEARLEAARINKGGSVDAVRLERALGELALATKTIQRLLVAKGVCSNDELRNTLQKVDAEDGLADGRAPIG
jgi:tRNA A37 threonylcarbamoyltransferase TsaD